MDRNTLLNDAETAQLYALDGRQAKMWTAIPGFITSINFAEMTVEVQPAIKGIQTNTDGSTEYIAMPILPDVPIVFPAGGSFIFTMPLAIGDEVLVMVASRCIDDWWQSGGIGLPLETRMHDLSDAFAIPGPRSQPKAVSGISSTTTQLRTVDGSAYIELTSDGRVNILAPGGVHVTGTINATDEITAVTSPLHTHVHGDPQGGNTGPPIP